jgi:BMFP domain-containing protein YqiC
MSEYFKSNQYIIKQLVAATIKRLKLVTREEFEVQTQVLLKTRLKVEQLEKKLMELNVEQSL